MRFLIALILGCSSFTIAAQTFRIDSLKALLSKSIDTSKVNLLIEISNEYSYSEDTGSLNSINDFTLKGVTSYNGRFVKASIKVEVKPTRVSLTDTGSVYGVFGNELFSGALAFYPDWAAHTIRACYTNSFNAQVCLSL